MKMTIMMYVIADVKLSALPKVPEIAEIGFDDRHTGS